jgi:putative acetyltransferase
MERECGVPELNRVIRKGRAEDRGAILEIWLRAVRATHGFLTEAEIQELLPLVRDAALPSLEIWVETAGDEMVGFAGLDGAKLEALFIDPAHFRRGVGRRLIDRARQLKGPLTVDVNEQNPEAVAFYRAMGFDVAGRSPLDGQGRPYPLLHLSEVTSSTPRTPPPRCPSSPL